jgi:ribosomal protein S18 acetylase RimI-like enzyme
MDRKSSLPLKVDKWDSGFFNVKISRLNISGKKPDKSLTKKMHELIKLARRENIAFLVIKLIEPNPTYEKTIRDLEFEKCGESIDLALVCPVLNTGDNSGNHKVRLFKAGDREEVRHIAKDAFRLSYLYKCGFAKRDIVDSYHIQWIENLTKDKSTVVFVIDVCSKVAGFIAMSVDRLKRIGVIVLIAVKEEYRGLNIGKSLVQECIEWGVSKVKRIEVKTQKGNKNALSLYEEMGFKVVGTDKVFYKRMI